MPATAPAFPAGTITPELLGSQAFKREYGLKYAYVTGGMYRGIASKELVVKVAKAGMMGFLGTGGLELPFIDDCLTYIQHELSAGGSYGVNFIHHPVDADKEDRLIELYLRRGVRVIEASAFLGITPALVKYRARGLERDGDGRVRCRNKLIAKVSRPEVAAAFLGTAPERMVARLLQDRQITAEQAGLLQEVAMADDLCVEADSAGHTDGGVAYVLLPAMQALRAECARTSPFCQRVRIGMAGGIGTPEAAAAAFMLGADFIVTGSINQCTVEAATSDQAKDLLQQMNVQDTDYAPAGDMFELGAKVQVLKRGVFFPARANKLYDLYRLHNALEDIDEKTRRQIEEKYFKQSFESVYKQLAERYPASEIEQAERNPKYKMALIFKWYFGYTTRLALTGDPDSRVDYQIHCGPALGAFNQWVKGTAWEQWRNRHVDEIGRKLMTETAKLLNQRLQAMCQVV